MNQVMIVSHLLLWSIVLAQLVVTLIVLRQVGFLYLRSSLARARELSVGPKVGEVVSPFRFTDIEGALAPIELNSDMSRDLVVLFISPVCEACRYLIPAIPPLVIETACDLRWALVCTSGTHDSCVDYRYDNGLQSVLITYLPSARQHFGVGISPYVLLIRRDGTLISKGLINNIEQLESVLSVRERLQSLPQRDFNCVKEVAHVA